MSRLSAVPFVLLALSCKASNQPEDPREVRRKNECPDLPTWDECRVRLDALVDKRVREAEALRTGARKEMLQAWADYDALPKKSAVAFGAAYKRAMASADAMSPAARDDILPTARMNGRQRMAPLLRGGQAQAIGDRLETIVPSANTTSCSVQRVMWLSDDTAFSLLAFGFRSIECNDGSVIDLKDVLTSCFLYPTMDDRGQTARADTAKLYSNKGGPVWVWRSLDFLQKGVVIGNGSAENSAQFTAAVSSWAKVVSGGSEVSIRELGADWLRVEGHGTLHGLDGYVEIKNCHRTNAPPVN